MARGLHALQGKSAKSLPPVPKPPFRRSLREAFPSLTGLRFVLALWIAVYHLVRFYGPPGLAEAWWIKLGDARVDVFFALSGFVLAHVYAAEATRFDAKAFFAARIARLYPLHLLGLGVLLVAVAGAAALGRGDEAGGYSPLGFVANLLMLQAWGVPGAAQWNFPVWTLSAETFSYLLFPLAVAAAPRLRRRPFTAWAAGLAVTMALGAFWPLLDTGPLAEATQTFGAVRGALEFFVGVAARLAFARTQFSAPTGLALAVAGAAVTAIGAVADMDLWVVAAGASLLVFAVAGLDRAGAASPLAHPAMQELGRWSYALFALHIPLFVIMTHALRVAGVEGPVSAPVGAAIVAVALAVAAFAHHFVEEPARRAIRAVRLPRLTVQNPLKLAN